MRGHHAAAEADAAVADAFVTPGIQGCIVTRTSTIAGVILV